MAMLRSLPNLATRSVLTRDPRGQTSSIQPASSQNPLATAEPAHRGPYHLLVAGFEALDLINVGLIVAGANGQLLLANRTAEVILESRDGLEVSPAGVVRTSLKSAPGLNALMETVARAGGAPRDSVLPVRRPSGKRPLTAVVRAVAGADPKADPSGPVTLLFILDPEISVAAVEAELRQIYGLTLMQSCLSNLRRRGK